jgi:hypothetical protein
MKILSIQCYRTYPTTDHAKMWALFFEKIAHSVLEQQTIM